MVPSKQGIRHVGSDRMSNVTVCQGGYEGDVEEDGWAIGMQVGACIYDREAFCRACSFSHYGRVCIVGA